MAIDFFYVEFRDSCYNLATYELRPPYQLDSLKRECTRRLSVGYSVTIFALTRGSDPVPLCARCWRLVSRYPDTWRLSRWKSF